MSEYLKSRVGTDWLRDDLWEPADRSHTKYEAGQALTRDALSPAPPISVAMSGAGGGRSLIADRHIDVVPPGPPQSLDERTFKGPGSGWLRAAGRGAVDMKGGVASDADGHRDRQELASRFPET